MNPRISSCDRSRRTGDRRPETGDDSKFRRQAGDCVAMRRLLVDHEAGERVSQPASQSPSARAGNLAPQRMRANFRTGRAGRHHFRVGHDGIDDGRGTSRLVNFTVNLMSFRRHEVGGKCRRQRGLAVMHDMRRKKKQQARNFDRNFAGPYNRGAKCRGFDLRGQSGHGVSEASIRTQLPAAGRGHTRARRQDNRTYAWRLVQCVWGPHRIPLEAVGRLAAHLESRTPRM